MAFVQQIVQLFKIPVLIQPFYILRCPFQLFLKKQVAVLEGTAEGIVEMAIEAVHFKRFSIYKASYSLRFHNMKTCGVVLVKLLHFCNEIEAIIIVAEILYPAGSASVLHRFQYQVRLNHLLCRFGEESCKNNLVY